MMKKNFGILSVLVCSLLMGSCVPATNNKTQIVNVSQLSGSSMINEGTILYGLPRTVFTVKLKMERTVEIPGPYSEFASSLLGLNNVIMEEDERWTISGVTIDSHGELDPSELYLMESNTELLANMLTLKSEGFILDLNPGSASSVIDIPENEELNSNNFVTYDLGSDEYYFTKIDTAYRRVSFESSFINVPYIVEQKTPLSKAQLAERAAKRLMEIRDGKILILTGEANVFPQSGVAINEINKMEKDYTELFVGKRFTETRYFTCQIIPQKESAGKPITLFKFAEQIGVTDAESSIGSPLQITFEPEQKLKEVTVLAKNSETQAKDQIQKVFFRIPDMVNVTIGYDGKKLYNSRKLIYQYGETTQLPALYIIGK